MARIPDLDKGQEVMFVRGVDSDTGIKPRRYAGKVKETMADAVRLTVTDERWGGAKETIVRYRDLVDPETGEKYSISSKKKPVQEEPTLPRPSPFAPPADFGKPEEPEEAEPASEPEKEVRFAKTDLDTWLSMGREMLASIDTMIGDKKMEIAMIEEDIKGLIDQRNTATNDINDLEQKRKMLQQFYEGEKA